MVRAVGSCVSSKISPVRLLRVWPVFPGDPGMFEPSPDGKLPQVQLLYPGGDSWRDTIITINQNPNVTASSIRFVSEEPYLQYNFVVETK